MEYIPGTYELTPPGEVFSRIERLRRKMEEKGIDLVLLIQNVDIFYFTGTLQNGFLLAPREESPLFIVQKDYERAVSETPVKCIRINSLRDLPPLVSRLGFESTKVGMELDVIPVSLFQRIRAMFPNWDISSVSDEIKILRSVKSEYELRQIKISGRMITEVFGSVKDHLREGITEIELDAILVSIGRSLGHQGFLRMRGLNQEMMNIQVISGENGGITSFCDTPLCGKGVSPAVAQGSSRKKIKRNEPIVIDYGGCYNGYITDETRVFVIGELKEHLLKAYETALRIVRETERLAKVGETPANIYEQALQIAASSGFAENFMGHGAGKVSFVGHGLGLEINELPIISRGGRKPLEKGMVFAFEPKFVFPGEGAIGVELDYIIREDGLERVTTFPHDIVYL